MKHILYPLLFFYSVTVTGQTLDTTNISITNFRLDEGTFSWRGTNTFHNMTSWDSSPYREGNLKQLNGSNWQFRMNYRLLLPEAYDAAYKPGYPLLVVLHGAGERGNCWDTRCYCEGCNPNDTPNPNADPRFLNNDHSLLHGGQQHLAAVRLAGTKKPNDASLPARAFPGIVVFPQNESFWGSDKTGNSGVSYAVRIVRLLAKQYNVDPNRIYIQGISFGGQTVFKALNMAPWLFAGAALMSPLDYTSEIQYAKLAHIPLWIFQGAKDTNPKPSVTENIISRFRDAGGVARYTLYEHLGHGTWNQAMREPDFYSWLLQQNKTNIHAAHGNPNVCMTNKKGASLELPAGFPAYQWEFNGQLIPNATANIYVADKPGSYRARFSRISSTPTEAQWNSWSPVLKVGEMNPGKPTITQGGSTFLRDLNGAQQVVLRAPAGYAHYQWYKDSVLTNLPDQREVTINAGPCGTPCANQGAYTLVTVDVHNCPSQHSEPKYLFFEDQAPVDVSMKPAAFTHQLTSSWSVLLSWEDLSAQEAGFELWRKPVANASAPWQFVTFTDANTTFYHDTLLTPNTEYYYKLRAGGNTGRSPYVPGDDPNQPQHNLLVKTSPDNTPPFPPQNITATQSDVNSITVQWQAAPGSMHIREYIINLNDQKVRVQSDTTQYVFKDLPINTHYYITVQAVNTAGIASSPGNQAYAHTFMNGLHYKHSTGNWTDLDDSTLVATWESPEYTGVTPNLSLTLRTQEDYFNFEFDGYLYITQPGTYTFYLNSSDGSRLYIDSNVIIDFNGLHPMCSSGPSCPNGWGKPSSGLTLTAGAHRFTVRMFEFDGPEGLVVRYSGPDTNNTTIAIPSSAFTSGTYTPPVAASQPANVTARQKSMTELEVAWQYTAAAAFEVYRSGTADGTYTMIARANASPYVDKGLIPGRTYYYKVKSVPPGLAPSAFSAVASARTLNDTQAPSQPKDLRLTQVSQQQVSLQWTASTDNVAVAGYDILANGTRIGTAAVNAFQYRSLTPGVLYTFTVVAFDASGNRSQPSTSITNEIVTNAERHPARERFEAEVYPNPAVGQPVQLKVTTPFQQAIHIRLLSVTGQLLDAYAFSPEELQQGISLPVTTALPEGIYFIMVEQAKHHVQKKILIRKQ
jgi:predicted esterase